MTTGEYNLTPRPPGGEEFSSGKRNREKKKIILLSSVAKGEEISDILEKFLIFLHFLILL